MANPKYAPLANREAQKRVVKEIDAILHPDEGRSFIPSKNLNRETLNRRFKQESQLLKEMTPPRVETEQQREYVVSRLKTLENAIVFGSPEAGIPPIPSKQEMWEPDAGNVGKHRAFEDSWKKHNVNPETGKIVRVHGTEHRGVINEWKDLRRALYQDREEYDPDVANIEHLRPDKKLDAMNQKSATFGHPLANKTWAEYQSIMGGVPELNDVQLKIIAAEESGQAKVPHPGDLIAQPKPRALKVQEPKKPEPEKEESIVKYVCGHETKNGTICKTPVKVRGEKCRWHKEEE